MAEISEQHDKRGYLERDFAFFHLQDHGPRQIGVHYHDFHKIVIALSGETVYRIEGRAYALQPWDMLLVGSQEIHAVEFGGGEVYDRIVVWLDPAYLTPAVSDGDDLLQCFQLAARQKDNLLRPTAADTEVLAGVLRQWETAEQSGEFGAAVLARSCFLQYMVLVNRAMLAKGRRPEAPLAVQDEVVTQVLQHINQQLDEVLSVEQLAAAVYLSKYHLMRRFKQQTGYTIHQYILQKRLMLANKLIREGHSLMAAAERSGFQEYSTFIRAFKRAFGMSPRAYHTAVAKREGRSTAFWEETPEVFA